MPENDDPAGLELFTWMAERGPYRLAVLGRDSHWVWSLTFDENTLAEGVADTFDAAADAAEAALYGRH